MERYIVLSFILVAVAAFPAVPNFPKNLGGQKNCRESCLSGTAPSGTSCRRGSLEDGVICQECRGGEYSGGGLGAMCLPCDDCFHATIEQNCTNKHNRVCGPCDNGYYENDNRCLFCDPEQIYHDDPQYNTCRDETITRPTSSTIKNPDSTHIKDTTENSGTVTGSGTFPNSAHMKSTNFTSTSEIPQPGFRMNFYTAVGIITGAVFLSGIVIFACVCCLPNNLQDLFSQKYCTSKKGKPVVQINPDDQPSTPMTQIHGWDDHGNGNDHQDSEDDHPEDNNLQGDGYQFPVKESLLEKDRSEMAF